jgi:hypothetical protein
MCDGWPGWHATWRGLSAPARLSRTFFRQPHEIRCQKQTLRRASESLRQVRRETRLGASALSGRDERSRKDANSRDQRRKGWRASLFHSSHSLSPLREFCRYVPRSQAAKQSYTRCHSGRIHGRSAGDPSRFAAFRIARSGTQRVGLNCAKKSGGNLTSQTKLLRESPSTPLTLPLRQLKLTSRTASSAACCQEFVALRNATLRRLASRRRRLPA